MSPARGWQADFQEQQRNLLSIPKPRRLKSNRKLLRRRYITERINSTPAIMVVDAAGGAHTENPDKDYPVSHWLRSR